MFGRFLLVVSIVCELVVRMIKQSFVAGLLVVTFITLIGTVATVGLGGSLVPGLLWSLGAGVALYLSFCLIQVLRVLR